jgi:hypothetical protein
MLRRVRTAVRMSTVRKPPSITKVRTVSASLRSLAKINYLFWRASLGHRGPGRGRQRPH